MPEKIKTKDLYNILWATWVPSCFETCYRHRWPDPGGWTCLCRIPSASPVSGSTSDNSFPGRGSCDVCTMICTRILPSDYVSTLWSSLHLSRLGGVTPVDHHQGREGGANNLPTPSLQKQEGLSPGQVFSALENSYFIATLVIPVAG